MYDTLQKKKKKHCDMKSESSSYNHLVPSWKEVEKGLEQD